MMLMGSFQLVSWNIYIYIYVWYKRLLTRITCGMWVKGLDKLYDKTWICDLVSVSWRNDDGRSVLIIRSYGAVRCAMTSVPFSFSLKVIKQEGLSKNNAACTLFDLLKYNDMDDDERLTKEEFYTAFGEFKDFVCRNILLSIGKEHSRFSVKSVSLVYWFSHTLVKIFWQVLLGVFTLIKLKR